MSKIDVNNPIKIKEYLDNNILYGRKRMQEADKIMEMLKQELNDSGDTYLVLEEDYLVSSCHVDAYQNIRLSLFGEMLA